MKVKDFIDYINEEKEYCGEDLTKSDIVVRSSEGNAAVSECMIEKPKGADRWLVVLLVTHYRGIDNGGRKDNDKV